MRNMREPGQGAVGGPMEGPPAISNIYAPPSAPLDIRRLQPTIPIYLLLGLTLAVALILLSLLSWFCVGFAHLFPLIVMLDMPPEVWLMMEYIHLLSTPLLISPPFAQGLGMAIWQGCSFASLRRAYGEGMVSRGCLEHFLSTFCLFRPFLAHSSSAERPGVQTA